MGEWMYRATFSCRWVVGFTPLPLYPRGKSPRYRLDRRLGEPHSRSGRHGENSWPYRDWKSLPSVIQPAASRYTDYGIPAPQSEEYRLVTSLILSIFWIFTLHSWGLWQRFESLVCGYQGFEGTCCFHHDLSRNPHTDSILVLVISTAKTVVSTPLLNVSILLQYYAVSTQQITMWTLASVKPRKLAVPNLIYMRCLICLYIISMANSLMERHNSMK
jgi:hypothetical protein